MPNAGQAGRYRLGRWYQAQTAETTPTTPRAPPTTRRRPEPSSTGLSARPPATASMSLSSTGFTAGGAGAVVGVVESSGAGMARSGGGGMAIDPVVSVGLEGLVAGGGAAAS